MIEPLEDGMWWVDSGQPGRTLGISFGMHGNERPPIDAGLGLVRRFHEGSLRLAAGRLLLVHANPRASAEDQRWSQGGLDLNRCFHRDGLARSPQVFEEHRARAIVAQLDAHDVEAVVDFHCTVEPGPRFLMQHPGHADRPHADIADLLAAEVVLTDPSLTFGGVSLDEWMSTRERVGICYETGWLGDPALSPDAVREEMENLLAGAGLVDTPARRHGDKEVLELDGVVVCDGEGFRWLQGVGENLQRLAAGAGLGTYADGRDVLLEREATLIFPKKRPELVRPGHPLVYLASRA